MKIEIHRNETSHPIVYDFHIVNAYTKGNLYCILFKDKEDKLIVHKYPLCQIFRIVEDYK